MRYVIVAAVLAAGCSKEIGDECSLSSDCDPNGERICDRSLGSPGGYCTIRGCDKDTCPDEAVCVRFFTGGFTNRPCTMPGGLDAACSLDEICSISLSCVPRASEVRYCMRTCGDSGDCRDGYECRDRALMMEHGGEPVGFEDDVNKGRFCAAIP